jgi:hypothetical protein
VALLNDPASLAAFAAPPPEALALAEAAFGFLLDRQGVDDTDDAAGVLRDLARCLAYSATPSEA